jgi:hypothetical protein
MKTRLILAIFVTLIIGFFLGMLTSAQIRYHRLRPMRMYFSDDQFRDGFYRIIQPDAQQKEKIDQILNKYMRLNGDVQDKLRKELNNNLESMKKELDQNLTKDQVVRLKNMDERRKEMMKQGQRRHRLDSSDFHHDMGPHPKRNAPREFGGRKGPPMPPPFPDQDSIRSPR